MCLAIYRPEGHDAKIAPTYEELVTSDFNGNGDSVGVMWRAEGRLRTWRQVKPKSMHALHGLLCSLGKAGYAYAAHMRLATHGSITEQNAHPILMSDGAGIIHNGILPLPWSGSKDKCDTVAFAEWASGNLPDAWWTQAWIVALVEKAIGYNKIVVMSAEMGDVILHRGYGEEEDGLWFSNDSHKPDLRPIRAALAERAWEGGWKREGHATTGKASNIIVHSTAAVSLDSPAVGGWTHEGGDVCLRCADDLGAEVGGPIFREDIEGEETVCDMCGDIL